MVIPCINLATLRAADGVEKSKLLQELKIKVSEWGVFEVKEHGVHYQLLEQINAWSDKFFSMPLEAKLKTCLNHSIGFVTTGGADPSKSSSLQLVVKPQNPVSTEVDELWLSSDDQKLFKKDIDQYCASMAKLALEILQFLEEALVGSSDEKHGCFANALMSSLAPESEQMHIVRLNFYGSEKEHGPLRLGLHTDPNLISILHQDNSGLLVLKDEEGVLWEPEDHNSLIVNVGDCLQVLSNNVLPSIYHKGVGNLEGHDRISTVYLASPGAKYKLVPPQELIDEEHPAVPPTTYEDLVAAKYFRNTLL